MYQRALAFILSACLLSGSISGSAFAMNSSNMMSPTAVVAEETETEEIAETEETTETELSEEETTEEVTTEEVTTEEVTTEEEITEEVTTEEVTTEEEITEEVTTEEVTIEENFEVAVEEKAQALETGDTTLVLDSTVEVKVPYYYENYTYQYAVFTAPQDGVYSFAVENAGTNRYSAYLYREKNGNYEDYASTTSGSKVFLMDMKANQTAYIGFTSYSDEDTSVKVTTTKMDSISFEENEDGTYIATVGNIDIVADATVRNVSMSMDMALSSNTEEVLTGTYYMDFRINGVYNSSDNYFSSSNEYKRHFDADGFAMETEYSVFVVLKDSYDNVQGVANGLTVKTGYTDEDIIWSIKDITSDTVNVEYEMITDGLKVYAEPLSSPADRMRLDLNEGYGNTVVSDLLSGEEYRLIAMDYDGNIIKEEKFTTLSESMDVEYNVSATGSATASVNVKVTNYVGDKADMILRVRYTDLYDEEQVIEKRFYLEEENGVVSGAATLFPNMLEQNKEHEIEIRLQKSYGDEALLYEKVVKTVTTSVAEFSAEDISITLSQNETEKTMVDFAVELPEHATAINTNMEWRLKGAPTWSDFVGNYLQADVTTLTDSITGLEEGQEYEFRFTIPDLGIRKEAGSLRLGETVYSPIISADTDALNSILKYELQTTEALENATWAVSAYLNNREIFYKKDLTADNGYAIEYEKTSLNPETEYVVEWRLYKDGSNTPCNTQYQTIKTKKVDIVVDEKSVGQNYVELGFTLNSRMNSSGSSINVNVIPTEKETGYQGISDSVWFYETGVEKNCTLRGLKPNTTYTISAECMDYEWINCEITTLAEDRVVTVTDIQESLLEADIQMNISGTFSDSYGNSYVIIYYREVGDKNWNKYRTNIYSVGNKEVTLSGLCEDTTYEYVLGIGQSYNTSQEYLISKVSGQFTTLKDDRTITTESVDAFTSSGSVKAKLSGGVADTMTSYAYLYYREKGTDGAWILADGPQSVYYQGIFEMEIEGGLKEDTEYEYTIGIADRYSNSLSISELKFKVEGNLKTMADDREVAVKKITPSLNFVSIDITLTGEASGGSNYISTYYRKQGTEDEWQSECVQIEGAGEDTLELSGLAEGVTYEYVLGLGNSYEAAKEDLKKTKTGTFTTLTDDRSITLRSLNAYVNSFTVEVNLFGEIAKDNATNIRVYYREQGSEDNWECNSSDYRNASVCALGSGGVKENTTYEYVVGIGKGNFTKEDLRSPISGVFTTMVDDRAVEITKKKSYLDAIELNAKVTGKAAGGTNYVFFYYKKHDTDDEWDRDYDYTTGSEEAMFYAWDLEEDTEYDYVIGLAESYDAEIDDLKKTQEGTLKTLKDDRVLAVKGVYPYLQSAELNVEVSGEAADEYNNYAVVYYRKKGTDESWEHTYESNYGEGSFSVYIDYDLEAETTYEYIVGIGLDYNTNQEDLRSKVTGQFTTQKDTRILKNVGVQVGYEKATIDATVADNTFNIYTYLHCYYREYGAENWTTSTMSLGSSETLSSARTLTGLKQGTQYEYIVALSNDWFMESPDEVTNPDQKVTGIFTTKKSDYKINIITNEEKTDYKQAVLDVTAEGTNKDVKLYVTLWLENGQSKEVVLPYTQSYKNTVTFTGLSPETVYSVTTADIYVVEDGSKIQIDRISLEGVTIKTKKAIAPTEIKLSREELFLNVACDEQHFSYEVLKATVMPEETATELIWTSSNLDVATVSSTGIVTAQASGKAQITVTSAHNPEVFATCDVTVANYVIARALEDGTTILINGTGELAEGNSIGGLGLYEVNEDDTLTCLEGVKVTPVRTNVVSASEDEKGVKLTAKSIGTTNVYFEKDGFKNYISIDVVAVPVDFAIVDLRASDNAYPAIWVKENTYEITYADGLTYSAIGEIAPEAYFNSSEFTWISSDEEVVTVAAGVITPKKSGSAYITVTPVEPKYAKESVKIELLVKELPEINEELFVYAVTNAKKDMRLKDVAFPSEWGTGWSWRNPETPLYNLPVNNESYKFEAYYSGEDKYAVESSVNVYMATVTALNIGELDGFHNGVIQTSGVEEATKDALYLGAYVDAMGTLPDKTNSSAYVDTEIETAVDGLTIEETEEGAYKITAQKAGNYVIKATANLIGCDENGEQISKQEILTKTYKLKAVDVAQANEIVFSTDSEGITIDESGKIILDYSADWKGKTFTVNATVKDRNKNALDTAIDWKITDKTVATVSYDKKKTHKATVTIKGSGHAVLSATAKDDTKFSAQLGLQLKDYAPRVSSTKANVNLAFDYDNYFGKDLAKQNNGLLEIVEVYDNYITKVKILKEDGTPETRFDAELKSDGDSIKTYLIRPTGYDIPSTNYKCILSIQTGLTEAEYQYPLTVSVTNKKPAVKAKTTEKVNLFYLARSGEIGLEMAPEYVIDSLKWIDGADSTPGFEVSRQSAVSYSSKKRVEYYNVGHEKVEVVNGKPADSNIAKGTLIVKLEGIRDDIEIKNFKIGYQYKKPKLQAKSATTSVVPKTGNIDSYFEIYDPQIQSYLQYGVGASANYYNSITADNDKITFQVSGSYIYNEYHSTKKKEVITYTLDSDAWRDNLQVKHTIKVVEPKAYLANTSITYNKFHKSGTNTYVYLKNYQYAPEFMDVEFVGSNTKANELLEQNIFDIVQSNGSSYRLEVRLNQAKLIDVNDILKKGTYSFKLTPYYENPENGEKVKMNTLVLKLKVEDKPITVKVSPKGTIDIAKACETSDYESTNSICLNSKFANLGTGYTIIGANLTGEYSKYFKLVRNSGTSPSNYYYLKISDNGIGKVKAGHTYKLGMEYTVQAPSGDTFVVKSNVFNVKAKQTAPKITVYGDKQTLYAANKDISRVYTLTAPWYYAIENANGYLDVNKDGMADIRAYIYGMDENETYLRVELLDEDAVAASTKGKAYNIPITVKVVGRDGISKDAKTTIKVIVKR